MSRQEIEIIIDGDEIKIDNVCGHGASCEKIMNEILKAAGAKAKKRYKKPQYYQGSGQKQTIKNTRG